MKKIYLAIPYTGNEEQSFETANRFAAKFLNEGNLVFSPISMCHPIAKQESLPSDWEFWKRLDTAFIEWCDEVVFIVPNQYDFVNSKGCRAEYEIARQIGKGINFVDAVSTFELAQNPYHLETLVEKLKTLQSGTKNAI